MDRVRLRWALELGAWWISGRGRPHDAGADGGAWWLIPELETAAASGQQAPGKRSPAGRARRLLNPFPGVIARAIINAVYGFSSLSRLKAGGSVPDPDRLPGIEPRSPRVGFNKDKRHPLRDADHGVEPCSSGVHVDAGHHTRLKPFRKAVVGIANIVQEVTAEPTPKPRA